MTNKEAIANLNHIYGFVSPDTQRSLDLAIKALEEYPTDKEIQDDMKRTYLGDNHDTTNNIRWTDKIFVDSDGTIRDFNGNIVGHWGQNEP